MLSDPPPDKQILLQIHRIIDKLHFTNLFENGKKKNLFNPFLFVNDHRINK